MYNPTLKEFFLDNPELKEMWSPKNPDSKLNFSKESDKPAIWDCPKCHNESEIVIQRKTHNKDMCYSCNPGKKVIAGVNDLATLRPDVAKELHKDNEISPSKLACNSKKKLKWQCSYCGNIWRSEVYSRTRKHNCPQCVQRRITAKGRQRDGSLLLAVGHFIEESIPGEIKDFLVSTNPEKEYERLYDTSRRKKANWKCKICDKSWTETPKKFLEYKSCPFCDGGGMNSRGVRLPYEKTLSKILDENTELREEYLKCKDNPEPNNISYQSAQMVHWKCNKGHIWSTPVYQRVKRNNGKTNCPKCHAISMSSRSEREVLEYVRSILPDTEVKANDRKQIYPQELDIYIPSKNIAIEYNGLYWHSNKFINRTYHKDKYLKAQEKGIQIITVWEDNWKYQQEVVKKMLRHKLGCDTDTVYARKCTIDSSLTYKECEKFMNDNHIQGAMRGSIHLGLKHNDELVSLMVFTIRKSEANLVRYCTSKKCYRRIYETSEIC